MGTFEGHGVDSNGVAQEGEGCQHVEVGDLFTADEGGQKYSSSSQGGVAAVGIELVDAETIRITNAELSERGYGGTAKCNVN